MAFPPTYDISWDITFPPDTQLANLLGQDIRNLTKNVMERLSALSGTLANRPTPEATGAAATWGGTGFGFIYFATDTNQVFQWSGTAWVDITGSIGAAALPVVGGTVAFPGSAATYYVWRAPYACHCTHLWGLIDGTTGSVINALHNGAAMFVNLTLNSLDTFIDGGAVNVAFAVGDTLALQLVSVSGSPNYITWDVYFSRP